MHVFALIVLLAPPGWSGVKDAQGRRTGEWVQRSTKGAKLAVSRYRDGLLHGAQTVFKPDGSVCWSGTFEKGTGTLERYVVGCRLKDRTQFLDGRVHGKKEVFDRNGRKVSSGTYTHGLAHGMHLRWSYPTKGAPKLTYRCMFAGRAIWRSVHGNPIDACAVDAIAGTGIWRAPLFRRTKKGMPIEHVFSKGPGAKAGLKAGDIILSVGGRQLPGPGPEGTHRLMAGAAGTTVRIIVRRGDKTLDFTVERAALDLKAWVEEMEAAKRARPKGPVKLLTTPEPRWPGRGGR